MPPVSLVCAPPLGGVPFLCGLTYLSEPAQGEIGGDFYFFNNRGIPVIMIISINCYDWKVLFFLGQDKIPYILDLFRLLS